MRRHAARELCPWQILQAFERMRDDPDPKLRRQVRKLQARHRRTGRINLGAH